jgi:hypothetical protein
MADPNTFADSAIARVSARKRPYMTLQAFENSSGNASTYHLGSHICSVGHVVLSVLYYKLE